MYLCVGCTMLVAITWLGDHQEDNPRLCIDYNFDFMSKMFLYW